MTKAILPLLVGGVLIVLLLISLPDRAPLGEPATTDDAVASDDTPERAPGPLEKFIEGRLRSGLSRLDHLRSTAGITVNDSEEDVSMQATTSVDPVQALFPAGLELEKVATGYNFTEGPAADDQGHVYFTNKDLNHIHRYDSRSGETTLVIDNSGAANGTWWQDGWLYCCEDQGRVVSAQQPGGQRRVVADMYNGKPFNSPNDLCPDSAGGWYFTDPRYGKRDSMQLPEHAYHVSKAGVVTSIVTDCTRPNGIALSRDGKLLLVADEAEKLIRAYDIAAPGQVSNSRVWAEMDRDGRGGPDGMTVDTQGRVFVSGQYKVWIWDSAGKLLAQVPVPEFSANCELAGGYLYVTGGKSLYRVRCTAEAWRP